VWLLSEVEAWLDERIAKREAAVDHSHSLLGFLGDRLATGPLSFSGYRWRYAGGYRERYCIPKPNVPHRPISTISSTTYGSVALPAQSRLISENSYIERPASTQTAPP
jgi:hypothetical protein